MIVVNESKGSKLKDRADIYWQNIKIEVYGMDLACPLIPTSLTSKKSIGWRSHQRQSLFSLSDGRKSQVVHLSEK